MAVLICNADGNLTGAATFATVATASASALDSEAASTASTTAYVESQALTPGAVTIDAILVKVAARIAVPAGTMSVRLAQAGVTVAGTEVTINVSDIEARAAEQGWYMFKFAAPVLLVVATAYTVSIKTSVNAEVTLYRDATPGNWSRFLRTTTAGTPGAGDNIHVVGEYTAAATKTDRTVTMDQTAATDYGDNTAANPPQFTVGKGGILTWGTTAATAYILKLSGRMVIYQGGVLNMGTTATPAPRDGSQELQFDVAGSDGDFGLVVFGTWNGQGQSRTAAKLVSQCLLNTDEAAAQTTLGVDTDTGWLSGDEIAIAATSRTNTEAEVRTLNGAAAATTIAITAGLTNAHSGTSPTQAEVILLTRNVRVVSLSTTLMAFVTIGTAAVVDLDWVGFRYLGANVTNKRGIECLTTSAGSLSLNHCSLREFDRFGLVLSNNGADNFSFTNIVGYKVGHQATSDNAVGHLSGLTSLTGSNWTITDVTIISNNSAAGSGLRLASIRGIVQRIRCSCGGGVGIIIDTSNNETGDGTGTLSDFNCHANGQGGLEIARMYAGSITGTNRLWRQNTASTDGGLVLVRVGNVIFKGFELFGNAGNSIICDASFIQVGDVIRFIACVSNGDTTFATAIGFLLAANNNMARFRFEGGSFGVATGIKVTHSTCDIDLGSSSSAGDKYSEITLVSNPTSSATQFANTARALTNSAVRYQREDGTTNTHRTLYHNQGVVAYETGTFHTASPSEKLTPSAATSGQRLKTRSRFKKADNAVPATIGVWVRKDGSYVGSTVRLVVKANPAIGITDDIVAASMTVAASIWEHLTYTTAAPTENGVVEYFVDCDGAAGNVYVDDWS